MRGIRSFQISGEGKEQPVEGVKRFLRKSEVRP
jgi:hypothetical protein